MTTPLAPDPVEATAGVDFTAKTGIVTFLPGEQAKYVYVTVRGDASYELDERFGVGIAMASDARGVDVGTATAETTIDDDDPKPKVNVGSVSLIEGNTGTKLMAVPVTLSTPAGRVVTVRFATSNGTATVGSDYDAGATTVTFQPGERTVMVMVPIRGDTTVEPNETITFTLSNLNGANAGVLVGKGTILNDDSSTALNVSIRDVAIAEGNSGSTRVYVSVCLNRANNLAGPVSVGFTTADESAKIANNDYQARTGTVTITNDD